MNKISKPFTKIHILENPKCVSYNAIVDDEKRKFKSMELKRASFSILLIAIAIFSYCSGDVDSEVILKNVILQSYYGIVYGFSRFF